MLRKTGWHNHSAGAITNIHTRKIAIFIIIGGKITYTATCSIAASALSNAVARGIITNKLSILIYIDCPLLQFTNCIGRVHLDRILKTLRHIRRSLALMRRTERRCNDIGIVRSCITAEEEAVLGAERRYIAHHSG